MSIASDIKEIAKAIKSYETFLDNVTEERFQLSPGSNSWSFSEVYSHILDVNFMSLIAIEKCINKTAAVKTRKPNWKVRLILLIGKFPPIKIKAPANIAATVKKISKEDAKNQLLNLQNTLNDRYTKINSYQPDYKIKHPVLGYLDAQKWLRFMLIHTKHHLNQIKRIEKEFS